MSRNSSSSSNNNNNKERSGRELDFAAIGDRHRQHSLVSGANVGNLAPSERIEDIMLTSQHAPPPPPPPPPHPPANQQGLGSPADVLVKNLSPEGSANQQTSFAPVVGGRPPTSPAPATASQQEPTTSTGQLSVDWMDSGLPLAQRAQAFQAWQAEQTAAWQAWQEAGAPRCSECNGAHFPPHLDEEAKALVQARKSKGKNILKSFQEQNAGAKSKAPVPENKAPKRTGKTVCSKCANRHTGECQTPKCKQCHGYHGARLTCFAAAQKRQEAGLPPVTPARPNAASDQIMFRDIFRGVHQTGSQAAMAAATNMFVATMEGHEPSKSSVPVRGKKRQHGDEDDKDKDKGKDKKRRGPPLECANQRFTPTADGKTALPKPARR